DAAAPRLEPAAPRARARIARTDGKTDRHGSVSISAIYGTGRRSGCVGSAFVFAAVAFLLGGRRGCAGAGAGTGALGLLERLGFVARLILERRDRLVLRRFLLFLVAGQPVDAQLVDLL